MKCADCEYFNILYPPYRSGGILWDTGRAECTKYNLVIDTVSKQQINKLVCVKVSTRWGKNNMSKYYYNLKDDKIVRDVCALIEKEGYVINMEKTFLDGTWFIIYINEKKRTCVELDFTTINVNGGKLIRWGDAEIKDGKLFDNWSESFIEF